MKLDFASLIFCFHFSFVSYICSIFEGKCMIFGSIISCLFALVLLVNCGDRQKTPELSIVPRNDESVKEVIAGSVAGAVQVCILYTFSCYFLLFLITSLLP